MERRPLASTAANYPFLLGLNGVPIGLLFALMVPVNLWRGPSETVMLAVFGVGIALCFGACALIARYYREHYGRVTPTARRYARQAVGLAVWATALFGATKLVAADDQTAGVVAVAFAAGLLAYSTILFGPRAHYFAVWGTLLVVGLLPIWGGLAVDWGSLGIGVAFMASGLLEHRLLVRSLGFPTRLNPDSGSAGT